MRKISLLLLNISLTCGTLVGLANNNIETTNAETTVCYTYDKVSSGTLESGKYLIVCEEYNVALNGSLPTLSSRGNGISINIENDTIAITNATTTYEFTYDSEKMSFRSYGGYYICGSSGNSNGMLASDTFSKYYNHKSVSVDDGTLYAISKGNNYLRYNKASNVLMFSYYKADTYTNQQPVQIYKRNDTANAFATRFMKAFTCDSTGQSSPTFTTSWSDLSTLYGLLDDTEKATLKETVASESGTTIQQAMARYDYVVNKYAYNDFIGRFATSDTKSLGIDTEKIKGNYFAPALAITLTIIGCSIALGYLVHKKKED